MREFQIVDKNIETKLPVRGTKHSAGYDFFSTETVTIPPKGLVKINTNIRAVMNDDEYLSLHVRSSLGIKKNIMLANCTGIIDSDFALNPDNKICGALYNYGDTEVVIEKGDAFMQGIFTKYYTTDNDNVTTERVGGIGSTGK